MWGQGSLPSRFDFGGFAFCERVGLLGVVAGDLVLAAGSPLFASALALVALGASAAPAIPAAAPPVASAPAIIVAPSIFEIRMVDLLGEMNGLPSTIVGGDGKGTHRRTWGVSKSCEPRPAAAIRLG
jgi:hypothetical protein